MYRIGKQSPGWKSGICKDITFVLTEDCNLRCKYCYITGKNTHNKMTLDVAKKAVDYLLDNPDLFPEESVLFNFIGGEPFLEVELMDQISDYIKVQMFKKGHKWFKSYMLGISTNGLDYHKPEVQKFVSKHHERLSIGFSVDGNKAKHDLQRVYEDGSGSYDDVMRNVALWLEQFPSASTKATFSHDDLPYLKDSIISLWENGIKEVNSNVVYEDIWQAGDEVILEEQLKSLADYIIDNDMYNEHTCAFFDEDSLGEPHDTNDLEKNWCGSGKMLAIDYQGNFYPCIRFLPYALNNRKTIKLGDIEHGLDQDKIRPFLALTVPTQSTDKCMDCEVATGCAWCQGNNYDMAKTSTIYERAIAICELHKARVRANNYFWRKLEGRKNILNRGGTQKWRKSLYIIVADDAVEHCNYRSKDNAVEKMSRETFEKALKFAEMNFFRPIILKSKSGHGEDFIELTHGYSRLYIENFREVQPDRYTIQVYTNHVDKVLPAANCILQVDEDHIGQIAVMAQKLFNAIPRVNLVMPDPKALSVENVEIYEQQLANLVAFLTEEERKGNSLEINVLTDRQYLDKNNSCNAGVHSFAVGPNGKLYICPAYYFDDPAASIGDVETGPQYTNSHLYQLKYAPICMKCDAYHCKRCIYLNQKHTLEVNTPTKKQCELSHLEREYAWKLNENMKHLGKFYHPNFEQLDYTDPLVQIGKKNEY